MGQAWCMSADALLIQSCAGSTPWRAALLHAGGVLDSSHGSGVCHPAGTSFKGWPHQTGTQYREGGLKLDAATKLCNPPLWEVHLARR